MKNKISLNLESRDYHQKIDLLSDKLEDKVIAWRHDIHKHPELANREFRTGKLIADHLKSLKLDEVRTNVAGNGVIGVLKGHKPGKSVIGLRADFDALPIKEKADVPFASTVVDETYPGGPVPVMHACGHDCHAAMLMGAAELLSNIRDQIPGVVKFIFQPAEEGIASDEDCGAKLMISEGALENPKPDCVFGIHVTPFPANTIYYCNGKMMAGAERVTIDIYGKQVHGSLPWLGKDPMPVAAEIITGLNQIYRQIDAIEPIIISIGKVDTVGSFNIIGDKITLFGTVRCLTDSVIEKVNTSISRIVKNIAKAYGLTAEAIFDRRIPSLYNKQEWLDRFLPTLKRVVGENNMHQGEPVLTSEDFSFFLKEVGGIYVFLGGQDTKLTEKGLESIDPKRPWFPNHNPHFYFKDDVLKTGVRVHANIALDYLHASQTYGKVIEEKSG